MDEKAFAQLISRLKNRAREQHTHPMQMAIEEYRETLTNIPSKEMELPSLDGRERAQKHRSIAQMFRKAAALQRYLKEEHQVTYPQDKSKETLPLKYLNEDHEVSALRHEQEAKKFDKDAEWREKNPNPAFGRPKARRK